MAKARRAAAFQKHKRLSIVAESFQGIATSRTGSGLIQMLSGIPEAIAAQPALVSAFDMAADAAGALAVADFAVAVPMPALQAEEFSRDAELLVNSEEGFGEFCGGAFARQGALADEIHRVKQPPEFPFEPCLGRIVLHRVTPRPKLPRVRDARVSQIFRVFHDLRG